MNLYQFYVLGPRGFVSSPKPNAQAAGRERENHVADSRYPLMVIVQSYSEETARDRANGMYGW